MKKLSFVLLASIVLLSACQDDKAVDSTSSTDTATSVEAVATTSSDTATKATTETTAATESTGESIHQANCTRCHGSEVYTRSDRQVTSLDALASRVKMCDSQLETSLFPEDMDKVVNYLNETHYKF